MPVFLKKGFQQGFTTGIEWSSAIIHGDAVPVLSLPGLAVINLNVTYVLMILSLFLHRNGEPHGPLVRLYSNPVRVKPAGELNVIQVDKGLAAAHLVKISKPGQIVRLVNSNDHCFSSALVQIDCKVVRTVIMSQRHIGSKSHTIGEDLLWRGII